MVTHSRRKGAGIGAFARECLVPASKHCEGRKGRDFQTCRRDYIQRCRAEKGFA